MTDPIGLILAAVVFFALGLGVGLLLRAQAVAVATAAARAGEQARHAELYAELARARAELDAERRRAAERASEAERSRVQQRADLRAEVELAASRLVDDKARVMLERSREGLEALLRPVAERLREFEAKVERAYGEDGRDRSALFQALRSLQAAQDRLHADADALARALTGESKAQGDWGELVLERVLETAGLTEGREYELQKSHVDADGQRRRPDALVLLPGDRAIVVDAKCSLTAWVEATRAPDAAARQAAVGRHVASLRAHVKGLAGKGYQDVLRQRTLDVVLLFVPSEAAFHAALAADPTLHEDAFRQRVVLTSPTTLLAALQLVSHLWRSERQDQNARRIADEAGKLLDKLGAFVRDLDLVGERIAQAQDAFASARSRLATGRGHVLGRAAALVRLGARVKQPERLQAILAEGAEEADPGDAAEDGPVAASLERTTPG